MDYLQDSESADDLFLSLISTNETPSITAGMNYNVNGVPFLDDASNSNDTITPFGNTHGRIDVLLGNTVVNLDIPDITDITPFLCM